MPRKPLDNEPLAAYHAARGSLSSGSWNINAHLPFVHTPIFVKNQIKSSAQLSCRGDMRGVFLETNKKGRDREMRSRLWVIKCLCVIAEHVGERISVVEAAVIYHVGSITDRKTKSRIGRSYDILASNRNDHSFGVQISFFHSLFSFQVRNFKGKSVC